MQRVYYRLHWGTWMMRIQVNGECRGKVMHISYDRVSEILEWKDLCPEQIDEEEGTDEGTDDPICSEFQCQEHKTLDTWM